MRGKYGTLRYLQRLVDAGVAQVGYVQRYAYTVHLTHYIPSPPSQSLVCPSHGR